MFSLISLKTSIESTTYRCDRNTKAIRDNSDTEETERGGGGGYLYDYEDEVPSYLEDAVVVLRFFFFLLRGSQGTTLSGYCIYYGAMMEV